MKLDINKLNDFIELKFQKKEKEFYFLPSMKMELKMTN